MRVIEIASLDNGAHRNQSGGLSVVPVDWAVIPADMECENFPFGEVEVAEINGVMTVTKWTPLPMPEPEPVPEPVPEPKVEPDVWDELAEAYKEGVQSAYDE
jgi:hypothetical protein